MDPIEKFLPQPKTEPMLNAGTPDYQTENRFDKYSEAAVDLDKEQKISTVREEIKNINKTAEIISVKSEPRRESNESNKAFLESVFSKLPKPDTLNQDKQLADEWEDEQEEELAASDSKKEPKGLKNLFKKLFS